MSATPSPQTHRAADDSPGPAAPPARAEGPAAAALLAAGFGAFVLGLLTTLAELSETIKDALVITEPVGPLSGKTSYAVAAWLIAWIVLHVTAGRRLKLTSGVVALAVVLVGLGLLGTFPLFFQLFAAPE